MNEYSKTTVDHSALIAQLISSASDDSKSQIVNSTLARFELCIYIYHLIFVWLSEPVPACERCQRHTEFRSDSRGSTGLASFKGGEESRTSARHISGANREVQAERVGRISAQNKNLVKSKGD